jgi:23S rRNA (guanine745-N1)-methyltransferase
MIPPDGVLECPVCRNQLAGSGHALSCPNGHSYDIARQGYVNLLPPGAHTGTADTAQMVAERAEFLSAGHYDALADAIAAEVLDAAGHTPGCLLDAGAGTGYYLARALDANPGRFGLALDLSKHAARRSARAHPRIASVVCDSWGRLPVADGAAAVVMNVFAPRNAAEFARVLDSRGALVTVTPTGRHLAGLVAALGLVEVDPQKEERLEATLRAAFARVSTRRVGYEIVLSRTEVARLVGMGPSARHLSSEALTKRVAALPEPVVTTLEVVIDSWTPRTM